MRLVMWSYLVYQRSCMTVELFTAMNLLVCQLVWRLLFAKVCHMVCRQFTTQSNYASFIHIILCTAVKRFATALVSFYIMEHIHIYSLNIFVVLTFNCFHFTPLDAALTNSHGQYR